MKWPLRFSLRTLFALMSVCAVSLFVALLVHNRGLRQRRACDEVTRLGGGWGFEPHKVPTHYDFCFRNIAFINLGAPVEDDDLAVLDEFPRLKNLGLPYHSITDQAVPRIARLKQLETLSMDGTAITDEAVYHLAKLRSLKQLVLRETAISDEGIADLRRALPNCEIEAHIVRRCSACREFFLTRRTTKANLCPKCEEAQANAVSAP